MDLTVSTNYQLSREDQQYGPYQAEQLVQMARSQQVLPTDHLWSGGMAEWTPAQSFSQLAPIFPEAAQQQAAVVPAVQPAVQTTRSPATAGRPSPATRKGVARPGAARPGAPNVPGIYNCPYSPPLRNEKSA